MQNHKWTMIFLAIAVLLGVSGWYLFSPSQVVAPGDEQKNYATEAPLTRCPEEWIVNKMPGVVGDKTPREYYILDGRRREVTEFDADWVRANCALEAQEVF